MKTADPSVNSTASGRRSNSEAPRIDPAEKATRKNRIEWRVLSFRDMTKMPLSENKLTMTVANTMTI